MTVIETDHRYSRDDGLIIYFICPGCDGLVELKDSWSREICKCGKTWRLVAATDDDASEPAE